MGYLTTSIRFLLSKWNIELANLALNRAELEAQMYYTQRQLDEIKEKDMLTLAYRIEDLNGDISKLRSTAAIASEEIDNLHRQLERLEFRKPRVSILKGR